MGQPLIVDYAWSHPDPAAVKQDGYVGVARYLSTDPSKNLTPAERDALFSQGLNIILVWETTAARALDGQAAGVADAQQAANQAAALGLPADRPIYFAVDTQATADQVRPYLQGAASVRRPVGVYGDIAVTDPLLQDHTVDFAWQTVAWSAGQVSQIAHLYQRLTPTLAPLSPTGCCDENVILPAGVPDWGQWPSPKGVPAPVSYRQSQDVPIPGKVVSVPWTFTGPDQATNQPSFHVLVINDSGQLWHKWWMPSVGFTIEQM